MGTNLTESAITPLVIRRKFLFCNTVNSANANASVTFFSLIEKRRASVTQSDANLIKIFTERPNGASVEATEAILQGTAVDENLTNVYSCELPTKKPGRQRNVNG